MPKLSAFLIVKDEEQDLPGCLASLKGLADEIVVVDSGSSDRTKDIAQQADARVLEREFDGFAAQKQYALEQCTGEWLLSIDADERVTPELAQSIKAVILSEAKDLAPIQKEILRLKRLAQNDMRFDGFRITREMFFLGKRLRFGGVGSDRVLRLLRKGKGRFRPVKVHESIEVDGQVGELKGTLQHFSYRTLEEYLQKREHYTTLAAKDLKKRGRRFRVTDYLRPGWEFFNRAILRGALLDGRVGLQYAWLSAESTWIRAAKLRALSA